MDRIPNTAMVTYEIDKPIDAVALKDVMISSRVISSSHDRAPASTASDTAADELVKKHAATQSMICENYMPTGCCAYAIDGEDNNTRNSIRC